MKNPELTKNLLKTYGGERIVIGVDGFDGKVATEGWLEQSDVTMSALISVMMEAGAKHFIVTDVNRDGTMQGANEDLLESLQKEFSNGNIIASGGIRNADDIRSLQSKGIKDSVLGKALYEGTITLEEIADMNVAEQQANNATNATANSATNAAGGNGKLDASKAVD